MSTIALHSPLNISETVRDRSLVPKDHQQEMAYGESDDVTWIWKVKTFSSDHLPCCCLSTMSRASWPITAHRMRKKSCRNRSRSVCESRLSFKSKNLRNCVCHINIHKRLSKENFQVCHRLNSRHDPNVSRPIIAYFEIQFFFDSHASDNIATAVLISPLAYVKTTCIAGGDKTSCCRNWNPLSFLVHVKLVYRIVR